MFWRKKEPQIEGFNYVKIPVPTGRNELRITLTPLNGKVVLIKESLKQGVYSRGIIRYESHLYIEDLILEYSIEKKQHKRKIPLSSIEGLMVEESIKD
jgi:hypothetical protein